ncbi:hypothetical protein Mapa_016986 [Marchantia paleacea]|nr:hypothetical protein Mapa_016986 [Marchantia paleacea]
MIRTHREGLGDDVVVLRYMAAAVAAAVDTGSALPHPPPASSSRLPSPVRCLVLLPSSAPGLWPVSLPAPSFELLLLLPSPSLLLSMCCKPSLLRRLSTEAIPSNCCPFPDSRSFASSLIYIYIYIYIYTRIDRCR